jgi:hypothetical protein
MDLSKVDEYQIYSFIIYLYNKMFDKMIYKHTAKKIEKNYDNLVLAYEDKFQI